MNEVKMWKYEMLRKVKNVELKVMSWFVVATLNVKCLL